MVMKSLIMFTILIFLFSSGNSQDPHDDNLKGKNLICFNDSYSIEDWGVKFLKDKKVVMYSLNKSIYEIYQYSRNYRTDLRNIIITKDEKIEYVINRSRLVLGNKHCKIIKGDPINLLQNRIKVLKKERKDKNKI